MSAWHAIVDWLPISLPLAGVATSAAYLLYTTWRLQHERAARQLHQQWMQLPHVQQRAYLLAAYGWTYAEIADELGDTPEGVQSLIHSGREALRHAPA